MVEPAKPSSALCTPSRWTYLGFGLLSACVVALELLITRVVSVRFGNHMSFAVISLAMFGLTVGAVVVHLARRSAFASPAAVQRLLVASTVLAGVAMPFALRYLAVAPGELGVALWRPALIGAYLVTSVPFVLAGVSICILLSHFRSVSRLYAADLVGAGVAGIGFVLLMGALHPSTTCCVLAVATCGAAAAFARSLPGRIAAVPIIVGAALGVAAVLQQTGVVMVIPPLGGEIGPPLVERWNAYSRVTVLNYGHVPFGWGRDRRCGADRRVEQALLFIDRTAATPVTRFTGDATGLDFLGCDATYAANAIRTGQDVLVVGLGGGRDVLANLHGGHRHVTAVEINSLVLELLSGRWFEFTGGLIRDPRVTVVHDEARSFVMRSAAKFGVIQISMVDTFAASATGAFALTENNLYTVEAFVSFLDHLTEDGVLGVSRWHYYNDPPFETLRTMALARAALERIGVRDVADHIVVIAGGQWNLLGPRGTATVLVKRTAFTRGEVEQLMAWSTARGLSAIYAPAVPSHPLAHALVTAPDLADFAAAQPLDISPPTDDRPFFFLMRRQHGSADHHVSSRIYTHGLDLLTSLLVVTVVLSLLVIIVPTLVTEGLAVLRDPLHLVGGAFFLAIGVAFMLVEIAQLQRLTLLLGHPILGLTVALSTLLVSSGIGSLAVGRVIARSRALGRSIVTVGALLVLALAVITFLTGPAVNAFAGGPLPVRILVAVLTLAPAGLFMGMLFPLGIEVARKNPSPPVAWFWALNGSASVVASVLAIIISTRIGIRGLLVTGGATYLAAVLLLVAYQRRAAGRAAS